MKKQLIRIVLIVLILVAAGGYIYWYFSRPAAKEGEEYPTEKATLKSVKEMAELATLDFHEEIAVKDESDGKWIVARMTIEGSVKYDMDSVSLEQRGDTLILLMPKESFKIYESADSASYQVIDTWDARRAMMGRKLTATEENTIKERARRDVETTLRERGYVARARKNASATLIPILRRLASDSISQVSVRFK